MCLLHVVVKELTHCSLLPYTGKPCIPDGCNYSKTAKEYPEDPVLSFIQTSHQLKDSK